MNLVVDIGNTVVKTGLFNEDRFLWKGEFATLPPRETDEWGIILLDWIRAGHKEAKIDRVVICSVAQSALIPLRKAVKKYLGIAPLEVDFRSITIRLICDEPQEVGADRIANVVGAVKLYSLPAVVIDFGTATTFDVISEKGEFLGGVIAPGIRVSMEALWEKTECLFPVEFQKPSRIIGKNTRDNLIAGIFYSCLGGIKEILRLIEEELGEKPTVIATGGWGSLLRKECPQIDEVNPNLTLQGLNFIAQEGSAHSPLLR